MSLDGRVAVVTGATKGVGRGIGRELAQHGARVFVTGRSAPDHERLDKQITGIRCDHRVDTQVEAAFNLIVREANAIDILVNSVWGGYERMVENGNFTWPKPFWEQPLWRIEGGNGQDDGRHGDRAEAVWRRRCFGLPRTRPDGEGHGISKVARPDQ